jgi:outer membrane protein assembly factor BamE (lipoprotein component of BamABCDE complex)
MTYTLSLFTSRTAMAAGLLLAASAAFSATGFTVTQPQEAQVTKGMSRDDVRGLLGRPSHNVKYMSQPGRTWTYGVLGASVADNTVFDIEFDASGKVMRFEERVEPMPK